MHSTYRTVHIWSGSGRLAQHDARPSFNLLPKRFIDDLLFVWTVLRDASVMLGSLITAIVGTGTILVSSFVLGSTG